MGMEGQRRAPSPITEHGHMMKRWFHGRARSGLQSFFGSAPFGAMAARAAPT